MPKSLPKACCRSYTSLRFVYRCSESTNCRSLMQPRVREMFASIHGISACIREIYENELATCAVRRNRGGVVVRPTAAYFRRSHHRGHRAGRRGQKSSTWK